MITNIEPWNLSKIDSWEEIGEEIALLLDSPSQARAAAPFVMWLNARTCKKPFHAH